MLFTLLLTALTATSGEDTHTHTTVKGRDTCRGVCVSLLPSGLAGSGSQEEGASFTWIGGNTTGKGERERNFTTGHTCQSPYIGYIVCSFLKVKGMLELIVVDAKG